MKLTPKQKDFADYYIELGNVTEAAKKAGYKQPHVQGSQTLEKLSVKTYIAERMAEKDSKRIAKEDEILEFLTNVLRGETTESIPIVGKDFFEMVDNTPSIKDRTKAAELLGKRYTMWTENKTISGNIGVTIIDDLDE